MLRRIILLSLGLVFLLTLPGDAPPPRRSFDLGRNGVIPSFEDSAVSNPAVENIPNAARGIRAALERHGAPPSCFEGIALYAEWVTTPGEWRQLREEWNVRNPG